MNITEVKINKNTLYNGDCIKMMDDMKDSYVDLTLTDIPYGVVNRDDNGLRNLDKGNADVKTFELKEFLDKVYRITRGTIIIFCSKEQMSFIHGYFHNKKKGTVRQGVWQKSNPMPSNGQYVYLSGIENFIWFRKPKATFNAHCKNTVFKHPNGSSKIHPTEKNHELLKELIIDNSNEGDMIFDPCFGSGSTLLVAKQLNRNFIGFEMDKDYFKAGKERIEDERDLLW